VNPSHEPTAGEPVRRQEPSDAPGGGAPVGPEIFGPDPSGGDRAAGAADPGGGQYGLAHASGPEGHAAGAGGVGFDSAGPGSAGPGSAGPGSAGPGSAGPGSAGFGSAGFGEGGAGAGGVGAGGEGFGPAHEGSVASRWWGMRQGSRRPWKRTAVVTVVSAAAVLVLGGPLGLLWAWIAPSVPVIATGQNIVVNDPSPEEYIAADGWYTLLGLGFGLLVAAVAWLVLRRDRGPFLLLGVVAGALGAGYLVAPWIGEMIGKSAYEQWQDSAARGATYLAPPEVHSTGPMLVPAFAAAIVLTLLAGWSNDPDLEQLGARPGYGPNAAAAEPYATTWAGAPGEQHPEAGPAIGETAGQQSPAEPPRA
jgi:hypothetical protein